MNNHNFSSDPKPIEVSSNADTIFLRQLTLPDAQRYFDLIDYDRTHFQYGEETTPDKYQNVQDVENSILYPEPNRYSFGIWNGGEMVGSTNLTLMATKDVAEVGTWIGAKFSGQDYSARSKKNSF